jgi:ubiquinone/menaquinone biosynthesis C-methylase UbiE
MQILVHMRRRSFIVALVFSAFIVASCRAQDTYQEEAARLAPLLNWQQGSVVAEIGGGEGQKTLAAATRVGTAGRVYTTELDPKKMAHLEELAAKGKNITAIPAGEAETNLPPECCDSIFMRLVYHHLTKPAEIDASLFRSLKPGGRLAVMDREPPPGSSKVAGVPENRGGHGMPQKILIEELTSAGFQVVKSFNDWPSNLYCVVFRKPNP